MTEHIDTMVRSLLKQRKGHWRKIADAAGVSYSWVCKFAGGEIPNPGYARLQRLHDHLTATPQPPAKTPSP